MKTRIKKVTHVKLNREQYFPEYQVWGLFWIPMKCKEGWVSSWASLEGAKTKVDSFLKSRTKDKVEYIEYPEAVNWPANGIPTSSDTSIPMPPCKPPREIQ
jgi:hypothetical protein